MKKTVIKKSPPKKTTVKKDIDLTDIKPKETIEGLGDVISRVTKFFGIKECGGCKERKAFLNNMFPHLRIDLSKLTQEDVDFIERINSAERKLMLSDDVDYTYELYNRLFNMNVKRSNCGACLLQIIEAINNKIEKELLKEIK